LPLWLLSLSFEMVLSWLDSTFAADVLGFNAIEASDGDRLTCIQDAMRRNGFLNGDVGEVGDDSVFVS